MAIEIQAPHAVPGDKYRIFLAGTIDMGASRDWQDIVVGALADYDVVLVNPRRDDWDSSWEQTKDDPQFSEQVNWEQDNLEAADFRIFNFEKDSKAPITFEELGANKDKPGAVCCPEGFYRKGNVDIVCERSGMPVYETLEELIDHVKGVLDGKGLAKRSSLLKPKAAAPATQMSFPPAQGFPPPAPKQRQKAPISHGSLPSFDQFVKREGGLKKLLDGMGDAYQYFAESFDSGEEPTEAQVLAVARKDLQHRYDEVISEHELHSFPLELYREVSLPGGIESLRLEGIGECWSWDEKHAAAHWGTGGDHYMLRAEVSDSAIDWGMTLWLNLDPSIGEEEKEIRLREGARIEFTGWKQRGGEWQLPKQRIVTAGETVHTSAKTAAIAAPEVETTPQESENSSESEAAKLPDTVPVTETPSFKAWFAGSKVVYDDGTPMLVYHGSRKDFTEFDTALSELGSHFGTLQQAHSFVYDDDADDPNVVGGNIKPCYLKITNPLRLMDRGGFVWHFVIQQLKDAGIVTTEDLAQFQKEHTPEKAAFGDKELDRKELAFMQSAIKAKGYDGIVYLNRREAVGVDYDYKTMKEYNDLDDSSFLEEFPDSEESWIAFQPSQIKSAIGNSGAFDPNSTSITASATSSIVTEVTLRLGGFDVIAFDPDDEEDDDGIKVVGTLQIDISRPGAAVVKAVDVDENYQRQGIALKLYELAKEELKARGVHLLKGALEGSGPLQIREKVFGPGNTQYLIGGESIPAEKAKHIMDVEYGRLIAETKIAAVEASPYQAGQKYNGPIPEIKFLPVSAIHRQEMDFRPEVTSVSDEVAQNMDYSEPVDVTAFRYGRDDDDQEPVVTLIDGHHRTAAALQTGQPWLPVNCTARNAKGEKLNALIRMSQEIEAAQSKTAAVAEAPVEPDFEDDDCDADDDDDILEYGKLGEPVHTKLYHGTNADITNFKLGRDGLIWFSNDPAWARRWGKNIVEAVVSIQRPFVEEDAGYHPNWINCRKDIARVGEKHDGIVLRNSGDDLVTYAVFSPSQVTITSKTAAVAEPPVATKKITDTPAFKAWFRNSIVKDDNGHPLVVYRGEHGEYHADKDHQFQSRQPSLSFGGPETASLYAQEPNYRDDFVQQPRVYPCYLRIENPVLNNTSDPFWDFSDIAEKFGRDRALYYAHKHERWVSDTGVWYETYSKEYSTVEQMLEDKPEVIDEIYMLAYPLLADTEFVNEAKSKGYDGAIHGPFGDGDHDENEYKVFDHSQVKSAIGNNGQFDQNSRSITAAGPSSVADAAGFKAWFAGSEVVNPDGSPMVMYHATQADIGEFRPFTHFGTQAAANQRYEDTTGFYDAIGNTQRGHGSNIVPVYLSIKNALRLPDLATIDLDGNPMRYDEDADAEDFDPDDDDNRQWARGWESEDALAMTLLEEGIFNIDEYGETYYNDKAIKLLEQKGYDGIVYKNAVEDKGNDSWIAFRPDQVKSAIGNNGGFDPSNKSITAAVEEDTYLPDVPTWEEYAAWSYEGAANAESRLAADILYFSGRPSPDQIEEAKATYSDLEEKLNTLTFPLDVYRAVRLENGIPSLNMDEVGLSWSFEEDKAQPIMGSRRIGTDYVLHGRIDRNAVDWGMTMAWALEKFDEEREVRLKKGSAVQLVAYRQLDEPTWHAFKKTWVTASKTAATFQPFEQFAANHGGVNALVADFSFDDFEEDWENDYYDLQEEGEEVPELGQFMESKKVEHLQSLYDDAVAHYSKLRYPLKLYRAITLSNGIDSLDTEKAGIHWSWSITGAKAYYGDETGEVILMGQVSEPAINWDGTLLANINPISGSDEKEICLHEGALVTLLKYTTPESKQKNWVPYQRTITAARKIKFEYPSDEEVLKEFECGVLKRELVSLDNLEPMEEPDQDDVRELVAKIRKSGVLQAIAVAPDYTIVNGHHRFHAAVYLGLKEIPVVVLDLPEEPVEAPKVAKTAAFLTVDEVRERGRQYMESPEFKAALEEVAPGKTFAQLTFEELDRFNFVTRKNASGAAVYHHAFPTWKEYLKHKGGIDQIKPGWHHDYENKRDAVDFIGEQYDGQIDYLNSLTFPLTVYRAVDSPVDKIHYEDAGIYWAVDPNGADVYGSPDAFGKNWTMMTAQIQHPEDVDWDATIDANLLNEHEAEIRVHPGTEMHLTKIETLKETLPQNRMIIAKPVGYDQSQDVVVENPRFKAWFRGSKVVDDHGRPLRVFHGTAEEFDEFQHGVRRSTRGVDSGKPAFYFTPDPDAAALWAANSAAQQGGDRVIPVYLRIVKPKIYRNWEDAASADVASLIAEGYDGFIRYYDEGNAVSDIAEIAVFRPNQIKSAIGNNGDFDPDSNSFTASKRSKLLEKKSGTRLTLDLLKQIAYQVRDELLPDRDGQNGDCDPVSTEIVNRLEALGIDAYVVRDSFLGLPHAWVQAGPYWVDATRDQFAYENVDDPDQYLDTPIVAGKGLMSKTASANCTCGHSWEEHHHMADFGCKHEGDGCGCKGWSDKKSKVASQTHPILYHVAPASDRASIEQHGINPQLSGILRSPEDDSAPIHSEHGDRGFFAFTSLKEAKAYPDSAGWDADVVAEIWEVQSPAPIVKDTTLNPSDPESEHSAVYCPEPAPASACKRILYQLYPRWYRSNGDKDPVINKKYASTPSVLLQPKGSPTNLAMGF